MEHAAIKFDFNHMMADFIGLQYGIDAQDVDAFAKHAQMAANAVESRRGQGMQGWMTLPYVQDEIVEQVSTCAAHIRKHFDAFVVLGIGGSALGPLAVQQALNHLHYNELPDDKRGGPKLYVEDNIDPTRMTALLDVIDLKKTCFNVITKSGKTAETMSQYLILLYALKNAVGDDYKKHIICTTEPAGKPVAKSGNLIKIVQSEGYQAFTIPDGVGGRFSELCPVGLLPAAVCGIDIKALLDGAKAMDQRCKTTDVWQNPALFSATLMYIAMTDMGINVSVLMPYSDQLKLMSDWYAQLWAESLGKSITRKGMAVNVGQTPVKTLGVTDQHSQLQLYTEGPYDKVITLLKVGAFDATVAIPHGCEEYPDVAFLGGKTLNELIEAERLGTEYALYKSGRMNMTIELPKVNAHTVGQLLCYFEMVTAYAGEFLDIDAYNQPGVEESKKATYALLGFDSLASEEKRAEMALRPARATQYLL